MHLYDTCEVSLWSSNSRTSYCLLNPPLLSLLFRKYKTTIAAGSYNSTTYPKSFRRKFNIRNRALDERAKMIVSGSWHEMKIKNKARANHELNSDWGMVATKQQLHLDNPFHIIKGESYNRINNIQNNTSNWSISRYRLIIQKPTKLKETSISDEIQYGDLQIITPDFEDFWGSILHVSSRRELAQTVKLIAMMHGFRLIVPSGNTRELRSTFRCNRSRSRKTPTQINRTWWPFAMIYSKVEGKPNYQLSRYRNIHNHPLDEFDMFTGIEVLHKVQYIVGEIKKIKDRASELLHKAEEEASLDDSRLPSEFDLDKEFNELQNGFITVDRLTVLQPNTKSACNSKIIQIDSLCKALAFTHIEDGDVVDPEAEGKESSVFATGVYLNTKEYAEEKMHWMKPRRLILEMTKLFEKDITEEYYPQFIPKENADLEDEKYRVKQNTDIFESVNLTETPNQLDWCHDILLKYSKLDRISEKISPYRIYEVPTWWNDDIDGDPLQVLEDYMPTYVMSSHSSCRFNDEDTGSDEEDKLDKDNQLPQNNKIVNESKVAEDDKSEEQSEQDWTNFLSENSIGATDDTNINWDVKTDQDAKNIADSVNILSEIIQEIEDDIEGKDWIHNSEIKTSWLATKNCKAQNSVWGLKRQNQLSESILNHSNIFQQDEIFEFDDNFNFSAKSSKPRNSILTSTSTDSSSILNPNHEPILKRQKWSDLESDANEVSSDSFKNFESSIFKENWLPFAANDVFNK